MKRGRRNPRYVFGGVDLHTHMPYAEPVEPAKIKGLTGKRKRLKMMTPWFRVYEVDGDHISQQWADFIGGGHPAVYQFIPKGEIWIDRIGSLDRRRGLMAHELIEALLMHLLGWTYTKAHLAATKFETEIRSVDRLRVQERDYRDIAFYHLSKNIGRGNQELIRGLADDLGRVIWKY